MTPSSAVRLERVMDAMEEHDLDALVLGRQDNATWATGMHRLWTAGTRPFGAGCVLVAEGRGVHLLSSWDDGIPDSVPFDHLYGVTWNPAIMAAEMVAIPGLGDAERIGVDALSPGFRRAAKGFAPAAELVPADDVLGDLRRVKGEDELEAIRAACVVARTALDAVVDAVGEGVGEAGALRAVGLAAAAGAGGTVPSSGVVIDVGPSAVTVDVGLLADDWEGGLGRTVSPDGAARGGRTEERVRALLAACEPGAPGGELQAAGGGDRWLVRGVGMGFERPVIGPGLGAEAELVAGDVLSIAVSGDDRHHREIAAVTGGHPELLT